MTRSESGGELSGDGRRQRGLCGCDSGALKEKGDDTTANEPWRRQKEEMTEKI